MKKSTVWQSIVSAAAIIFAVLAILNIPHPDWITGLLFWQAQGQREIAWHLGADFGYTHRITLVPDSSKNQKRPDTAQMQATLAVVNRRARNLSTTEPLVQLQGNFIVAQVPYLEDLATMTQTLQAPGVIEFIASNQPLDTNETVKTTLEGPVQEAVPSQEITTTEELDLPYAILVNNNGLANIELLPPRYGVYSVKFSFNPQAQSFLQNYGLITNPQGYICAVLDNKVMGCALASRFSEMGQTSSGAIEVTTSIDAEQAPGVSALLQSGMLPIQLRIEKVERAGPTMGEQVVWQIGIAGIIALSAAIIFLLIYYRLPGLLIDLALLAFSLFSLALCKLIPLPITLPSTIGLVTAGLSTLSGLVSIAARLRKGIQAGRPMPKVVEPSFSSAWPSIRNTHLVLLLFSVTTWVVAEIVAAQTIRWLGVSLVAGTLASLFVIMIFSRTLMRLIFGINAVQTWLNEHKWLLDI